jgi:hypothetical protein
MEIHILYRFPGTKLSGSRAHAARSMQIAGSSNEHDLCLESTVIFRAGRQVPKLSGNGREDKE